VFGVLSVFVDVLSCFKAVRLILWETCFVFLFLIVILPFCIYFVVCMVRLEFTQACLSERLRMERGTITIE